jgi:hypothetical protein
MQTTGSNKIILFSLIFLFYFDAGGIFPEPVNVAEGYRKYRPRFFRLEACLDFGIR